MEDKWILKHEFQVLDLSTPLADLDIYKDGIIALEAVETADSSRYTTRQPLQPVNVQPTQQTVKPEPNAEGIKSPPATPRVPNDENLFYQTPHGPQTNFPYIPPSMPPQAHPQLFNPTANTFSRQSPHMTRPIQPYMRAPPQSASPAATAQPGYSIFRSSYPNMAEGKDQPLFTAVLADDYAVDAAWRSWCSLKPEYRAAFESQARRSGPDSVRSPQPDQHPRTYLLNAVESLLQKVITDLDSGPNIACSWSIAKHATCAGP